MAKSRAAVLSHRAVVVVVVDSFPPGYLNIDGRAESKNEKKSKFQLLDRHWQGIPNHSQAILVRSARHAWLQNLCAEGQRLWRLFSDVAKQT